MEKNVYDVINEMDIDLEQYEQLKLTKFEEKKIMKKFSKTVGQNGSKTTNTKKYVGVAAAALIAFGAIGTIPTMASTDPTMYKIATFLGIDKDLASYETVVGQEVTKDGVTMRLNEVIIDNQQLIVSVTTELEDGMRENFGGPAAFVYINGQEVNKGASGASEILEDGTGLSIIKLPLGDVAEGEVAVKLSLRTPLTNVEKSPHWNFEFKANGDALKADTQTLALDKTYEAESGEQVTLHNYEVNQVEHRITYSQTTRLGFLEVRATDEKGNTVVFQPTTTDNGKGKFVLRSEDNSIVDEAKTLALALYLGDEQVGELFEITK